MLSFPEAYGKFLESLMPGLLESPIIELLRHSNVAVNKLDNSTITWERSQALQASETSGQRIIEPLSNSFNDREKRCLGHINRSLETDPVKQQTATIDAYFHRPGYYKTKTHRPTQRGLADHNYVICLA